MALTDLTKKPVKGKPAGKTLAPVKETTYQWEGTDRRGQKIKGEMSGPSEVYVKQQLRKQGVNPTVVRRSFNLLPKSKGTILPGDIALFSRQMATMMKAGLPLVQALELVGRGNEKPAMMEMILGVKTHVEGGNSFAESLAKYPLHFDDLFINLVDAGERSGALETLLDKVATYKEKTEAIKKKVKKALTYPIAVLVVAVIVTAILLVFVVPQFEDLFKGFGADLPAFTKLVIAMSRWLQANWFIVVGIGVGVSVSYSQAHKRSRAFRRWQDRVMLKFPIFGEILHKSAVARFARTLSTMFAAGVPLVDAMESVAKAAGNIVFTEAIMEMREQVSTGIQLQLTMSQAKIFPSLAVQMIGIGEESGALDSMCAKVADFYEEEVDNMVDALSSLMEPMIMAVLGVLVGGLVVAMYLPIFKLGSVV
jgi:type IV pilus assembly protein PilC